MSYVIGIQAKLPFSCFLSTILWWQGNVNMSNKSWWYYEYYDWIWKCQKKFNMINMIEMINMILWEILICQKNYCFWLSKTLSHLTIKIALKLFIKLFLYSKRPSLSLSSNALLGKLKRKLSFPVSDLCQLDFGSFNNRLYLQYIWKSQPWNQSNVLDTGYSLQ